MYNLHLLVVTSYQITSYQKTDEMDEMDETGKESRTTSFTSLHFTLDT